LTTKSGSVTRGVKVDQEPGPVQTELRCVGSRKKKEQKENKLNPVGNGKKKPDLRLKAAETGVCKAAGRASARKPWRKGNETTKNSMFQGARPEIETDLVGVA